MGLFSEPGRGVRRQLGRRERAEPGAGRFPALVEEDGGRDRLEGGGQQDGPGAAAALRLALAEEQVVAEVDPAGKPSQAGRAHDRRPARGQDALVVVGTAVVERLGDDEADDGVAEELEALVVADRVVRVLVLPRAVDERAGQERRVAKPEPEPLSGLGRVTRRASGLPRP